MEQQIGIKNFELNAKITLTNGQTQNKKFKICENQKVNPEFFKLVSLRSDGVESGLVSFTGLIKEYYDTQTKILMSRKRRDKLWIAILEKVKTIIIATVVSTQNVFYDKLVSKVLEGVKIESARNIGIDKEKR